VSCAQSTVTCRWTRWSLATLVVPLAKRGNGMLHRMQGRYTASSITLHVAAGTCTHLAAHIYQLSRLPAEPRLVSLLVDWLQS
jgi:hypothetical protein